MESEKTEAVAAYVAEVAKLAKMGITTEHSFRPALSRLLSALIPNLTPVNEAKRQACGAPDFILFDKNKIPVMCVETKDLGDSDLDGRKRTGNKEQFDRYKAGLDTIVFTDFLDFHFYRHYGQNVGTVRIAEWDGSKVSEKSENFAAFVDLMEESACGGMPKIDSAKRLAELMAGKARMLQRTAEAYLRPVAEAYDSAAAGAKPAPPPLLDMMLGFRSVLMPDVGPEEFSDIFAQTLTYGMFAARLNDPTPEDFSRYEAMDRIPNSNPFLKNLFTYVATRLEEELKWVVDDLADLFRAANVNRIMADYGKSTGMSDPMVHFYEDFLREYDAGLRKDRGVWYTPIQVVRFIVSAVDWALKSRFGLEDGLADSSPTQIEVEEVAMHGKKLARKVKKTVHRVQMLDPATGTGTFHAEAIRQIRAKFNGNGGLWPEYVTNSLLPRLNGFELLMASYTMAHVKLDFALRESGVTPTGKERFRIFLTDSLTDWHKELPGGLFASALAAEQQGADEVKRDIPVMVVMGNPPYSGESQNKGDWIMHLMDAYKVEPGGKVKLKERNPKWLNDDYVKFIRLAEHYVEKNGSGIVAYITPHGFLDNPTFRGMRWHLMQTFDEIWTLNLHGNSKKKEVAPDGGKDECVFDIMQGVAITLFVKCANVASVAKPNSNSQLGTGNTGTGNNSTLATFPSCRVFYADLWGRRKEKFAALESATMENVKWQELNPTEPMLFFVPKDTAGEAEWNAGFGIAELMEVNSVSIVTANDKVLVDSDDSELLCKVSGAFGGTPDRAKIEKYAYRPFDERFIYYDVRKVERPREKVMLHMLGGRLSPAAETAREDTRPPISASLRLCVKKNRALLTCRQLAGNDWSHIFVAENMVDDNCVSNKSKERGYVFPLYLYDENMGKVERRANLNPEIVSKISASLRLCVKDISPEDIFAYIYGVLHTPSYRKKFKEFLKTDFPRIPYPKDAAQFKVVAEVGRSLIDTHLMRDAAPGLSETRARFPKMGRNMVEEVRFDEGRVFINAEQYFDNVPQVAWEMPIGGYRPAEKWLKDRKGRALTLEDRKHYQRIIIALMKTAAAAEMLDASWDEAIGL